MVMVGLKSTFIRLHIVVLTCQDMGMESELRSKILRASGKLSLLRHFWSIENDIYFFHIYGKVHLLNS